MNLFGEVEEKMAKIEKTDENWENYDSFVCCIKLYVIYIILSYIIYYSTFKTSKNVFSISKYNVKIKNRLRNNKNWFDLLFPIAWYPDRVMDNF